MCTTNSNRGSQDIPIMDCMMAMEKSVQLAEAGISKNVASHTLSQGCSSASDVPHVVHGFGVKPPLKPLTPTGHKYDMDKNRVDLLDPEWMEGVGQVLTFGAKKYAANNWRGGILHSRLVGACLRHVFAFLRGEANDAESGLSHLLHASCCLMFLYWNTLHRKDLDDIWKNPTAKEE